MCSEFMRFLTWLESRTKYRWEMPKGVNKLDRKPVKLPEDDKKHETAFRSTQKETYNIGELVEIAMHADKFGRALIGLCVNCCFGASEVGQWNIKDYQLFSVHPYAKQLGFQSTQDDSWVVGKATQNRFLW